MHILFTFLTRFKELFCWIFNLIFGLKTLEFKKISPETVTYFFFKLDDLLGTYDLKL